MEALEPRRLLSANLLGYHGNSAGTGTDMAETVLTPANVNSSSFGKQFATGVDGQVYAQPLAVANVNITRGAMPGVHNVLFVATMNDSLYAIDANTGAYLWQDSFLNTGNPQNTAPSSGVTPVPQAPLVAGDLGPTLGILSTPVIDPSSNRIYVVANTQEIRNNSAGTGTDTHYVQRLWAVNLADGSAAVAPAVIGDTILDSTNYTAYSGYQYVAGPIVKGSGNNNPAVAGTGAGTADADGWIANGSGFNPAASGEIAFNALLQMTRTGLSLINGNIFMGFASHGDNGPYYGWVLGYNASSLANTAAFVTDPSYSSVMGNSVYTAQGGIWMSGGAITTDGTYLYLTTGNGAFNTSASNFSSSYFTTDGANHVLLPQDNDYGDAVLKLAFDPNARQTGSPNTGGAYSPDVYNPNGFGLKVADYFVPSNAVALNSGDGDVGSGQPVLLPSSVTAPNGDPLLVTAGKEGRIYLIDRSDLGGFNPAYPGGSADPSQYDRVVGEYKGSGTAFANASFYNGQFYLALNGGPLRGFNASQFVAGNVPPGTATAAPIAGATALSVAGRGGTVTISGNGSSNGILWLINPRQTAADDLLAYDASAFHAASPNMGIAPIYDTNSTTRDSLTADLPGATATKFSVPTVFNGMVYVGTGGGTTSGEGMIVGYGLLSSYLNANPATFAAPSRLTTGVTSSPAGVQLAWSRNSTLETETEIDRSADGVNWSVLAYVPNGTNTYIDTSAATGAGGPTYFYRVRAISGQQATGFSNTSQYPAPSPTSAPAAALHTLDLTTTATQPYNFTVTYTDGVALNAATLGNMNIVVSGPNGYLQPASLTPGAYVNGTAILASYTIPAPSGGWTAAANGTYTVTLQANQVGDTSARFVPVGALGTFMVNIPQVGQGNGGGTPLTPAQQVAADRVALAAARSSRTAQLQQARRTIQGDQRTLAAARRALRVAQAAARKAHQSPDSVDPALAAAVQSALTALAADHDHLQTLQRTDFTAITPVRQKLAADLIVLRKSRHHS